MKEPRYTHIKNVDFKKLSWILVQRKNDLRLTEQDLAKETGLSSGGINNILRNRFNPSWRSIKAICTALKVDYKAAIEVCKINPDSTTGEPKTISEIERTSIKIEPITEVIKPDEQMQTVAQPAVIQGTLELDIEPRLTRSEKLNSIIHNSFERQAAEYLLNLGYKLEKPVTITKYVTL